MKNGKFKRYLGDAVYADYDGFNIILTTENGIEVDNRIVLDPEVLEALNNYVAKLKEKEQSS